MADEPSRRLDVQHRIEDMTFRALLGALKLLPYRLRLSLMGGLMSRVVAPLAGYSARIRENLAHACPDLPEDEIRRLQREVPDNVGRTLVELYAGKPFFKAVAESTLEGPGADAVREAHAHGRAVIVVTAHLGNYLAPRVAFDQIGISSAALYNPMKNPYFNEHYVRAMQATGGMMVGRDRKSYGKLLRHLKEGGIAAIVMDQYMAHGAPLTFFGQIAPTATSAAELALKYDALFVPIYGVRAKDGVHFDLVCEAPIPHSDADTMTQAANDSLEALVRKHMGQWFWIHRRWKPERRIRGRLRGRKGTGDS